ncbi:MAG: BON domain-containing protein [Planctomycetota bacterium]|nr:MAG: BON domain-containing protein [Planctomycetota bacterium]REK39831.1 MAG: BON domain-containing protein [Planctomycetota bacterium]
MNRRYWKRNSVYEGAFTALLMLVGLFIGARASDAKETLGRIDDNDILEAVEEDLRTDNAVPEHQIYVEVRGGIVTLSGTSNTLLGKRRAQRLIESLRGVRGVVNRVTVPRTNRTDGEILSDVKDVLRDDQVADLAELKLELQDGVATLSGVVDSFAERELTDHAVAGVRGVVDIDNRITVNQTQSRSDAEILPEIERRLASSPWLTSDSINVNVENGSVTLTGVVGSVQEKSLARVLSWVTGVRTVDNRQLEVAQWRDQPHRRDSLVVMRNDTQLKRAVEDSLLYDPRVRHAQIAVHVRYGAVSLFGTVRTLSAKRAAEQDAKNTLGVRRVRNHLKVEPTEFLDDVAITEWANKVLLRDAVLSEFDVQVTTRFGKVFLSGKVNSVYAKDRAAELIANIPGALDLYNGIEVESTWQPKLDAEIVEDVRRRLRWSPLLDADRIKVSVDDGLVTLEGVVDTPQEREAATRHARQGGARRVVDQLRVRNGRVAPAGLTATLIVEQDTYELDAAQSGDKFRQALRAARKGFNYGHLPPAPKVDLTFKLQNAGDEPVKVRLGHDSGGFEFVLAGEGAEHIRIRRPFAADLNLGSLVTIEPGEEYSIPIESLEYGFRGKSDRWYWTEPGEYTLHVTLSWPTDVSGIYGEFSVTATSDTLTVLEADGENR